MQEFMLERLELGMERLAQIGTEQCVHESVLDYFEKTAARIQQLLDEYRYV